MPRCPLYTFNSKCYQSYLCVKSINLFMFSFLCFIGKLFEYIKMLMTALIISTSVAYWI